MRPGSRILLGAAALLLGAALAGCGPAAPLPITVTPPPPMPTVDAAAESPAIAGPMAPPRGVPVPTAPTVRHEPAPTVGPPDGPDGPGASGPGTSDPGASDPPATPAPSSSAAPTAPPTPAPTEQPAPAALVDLLLDVTRLPPLAWASPAGPASAPWLQLAPATGLEPPDAIAHLGVARSAGGACAAAADAVDGRATEAAIVALEARGAPGSPLNVVLLRLPSPEAADAAVAALHALGVACDGVPTETGVLGTGDRAHGATVLLTGPEAALVVEAVAHRSMLVAVVHEVAPPEAVAQLLAAQTARLG